MTLALEFGRPDVDAFASEMSSQQLTEWMAFDRISPIGPARFDLLAGLIAWSAGGFRGKMADYILRYAKPQETAAQKLKRIKAGFARLTASFNRSKPGPKAIESNPCPQPAP